MLRISVCVCVCINACIDSYGHKKPTNVCVDMHTCGFYILYLQMYVILDLNQISDQLRTQKVTHAKS